MGENKHELTAEPENGLQWNSKTYVDSDEDISETDTAVHCDSILIFLGICSYCDIVKYESKIKEHDIKTEIVEDIG